MSARAARRERRARPGCRDARREVRILARLSAAGAQTAFETARALDLSVKEIQRLLDGLEAAGRVTSGFAAGAKYRTYRVIEGES